MFESLRRRGWDIRILCGTSFHAPAFRRLARECGRALLRLQAPPAYVADEDSGFPARRGIHSGWHPLHLTESALLRAAARLGLRPGGSQRGRGLDARACGQGLQALRRELDHALATYDPDVVLGHYGVVPLLHRAALRGYPSFYYVHGTGRFERRRYPAGVHVIANSPSTAQRAGASSPHEVGLVFPMVDPRRYRIEPREARFVTFINPIPAKGADIAVEVARRMPEERFLFVEARWPSVRERRQARLWLERARKLGNVTVWGYQDEMREVYRVTATLLVPSRRESFGRVIVEAHANGIPVVAARVGGIPDALGGGGILVDPEEGAAGYVEALGRLARDRALHERLSALAIENSRRPQFDAEGQVEEFLRFIASRAS